jgi:hypothetical protein
MRFSLSIAVSARDGRKKRNKFIYVEKEERGNFGAQK